MGSERRRDRLTMGHAAVLAPAVAASLLPWRDSEALAWLRREGLIFIADGRPVVLWGEVCARIARGDSPEPDAAHDHRAVDLPRVKLEPIH